MSSTKKICSRLHYEMRFYASQTLLLLLPLVRGKSKSQHFDPALYANHHDAPLLNPHNFSPDYYYDEVIVPNTRAIQSAKTHEDIKNPNANYQFSYGVADPEHGTSYSRSESANDKGTTGQYQVHLPDGRIQTVKYVADENGYRAEVSYEGEAVHDETPHPNAIPHGAGKPAAPLRHQSHEVHPKIISQFPVDTDHSQDHVNKHQSIHRESGRHVQFLEPAVNSPRSLYPQIYYETVGDEPVAVTRTPFIDSSHFSGPSPIIDSFHVPNLENSFHLTSPTSFSPIGPRPPTFRQNSLRGSLTPSPHPIVRTLATHGPTSISHPFHFPVFSSDHDVNNFGSIPRPHPLIQSHARSQQPFDVPLFRKDTNIGNRFTRSANEDSTSAPKYQVSWK